MDIYTPLSSGESSPEMNRDDGHVDKMKRKPIMGKSFAHCGSGGVLRAGMERLVSRFAKGLGIAGILMEERVPHGEVGTITRLNTR